MKNADVPLWDKGDSTDNYAKGGARTRTMSFDGMIEADKNVESAFKTVLGRKPSTRESAYYRISRMDKNEIILKLISGSEHKDLIGSAKKYPKILEENNQQKSNILKLKSEYESRMKELEDLNKLLTEKNSIIADLRKTKDKPFISDNKILEESKSYHSNNQERGRIGGSKNKERSSWDKIIELFFK